MLRIRLLSQAGESRVGSTRARIDGLHSAIRSASVVCFAVRGWARQTLTLNPLMVLLTQPDEFADDLVVPAGQFRCVVDKRVQKLKAVDAHLPSGSNLEVDGGRQVGVLQVKRSHGNGLA